MRTSSPNFRPPTMMLDGPPLDYYETEANIQWIWVKGATVSDALRAAARVLDEQGLEPYATTLHLDIDIEAGIQVGVLIERERGTFL